MESVFLLLGTALTPVESHSLRARGPVTWPLPPGGPLQCVPSRGASPGARGSCSHFLCPVTCPAVSFIQQEPLSVLNTFMPIRVFNSDAAKSLDPQPHVKMLGLIEELHSPPKGDSYSPSFFFTTEVVLSCLALGVFPAPRAPVCRTDFFPHLESQFSSHVHRTPHLPCRVTPGVSWTSELGPRGTVVPPMPAFPTAPLPPHGDRHHRGAWSVLPRADSWAPGRFRGSCGPHRPFYHFLRTAAGQGVSWHLFNLESH